MELVESQNLGIPSVATSMARVLIRGSVKSRTGVEIDDLSPVKVVHKARVRSVRVLVFERLCSSARVGLWHRVGLWRSLEKVKTLDRYYFE